MKILLFSTQGISVPFLGIELEILEDFQKEGHDIHIIKCDQKLYTCFMNPSHNLVGCSICQARCDVFYDKQGIKKGNIQKYVDFEETNGYKDQWFETLDDVFNFEYEGINLGLGVGSSLITNKRDYNISSHKNNEIINTYIRSSINQFLNVKKAIDNLKPDLVLLFNGRFVEAHPIMSYCQTIGLDYKTFEKGSTYDSYEVFLNSQPHSIKTMKANMDKYWEALDEGVGEKVAIKWFHDKTKGTHADNINFVKKMVSGTLPDNFDENKINIAIFNSSEDEYKAIRERQNTLYNHQNDAIEQMVSHFEDHDNIHFYLRVHPNLEKVNNQQTQDVKKMKFKNFTLIPSQSSINSYDLMKACDKVVGFGSGILVEATFWGSVAILYGKGTYMNLDCTYVPKTFEELIELILAKDLVPKDKTKSYRYAYFINARGVKFKWFKWNGKSRSTFKGIRIKRIYPKTFYYLIKYMSRIGLWVKMNKLTRGRNIKFKDILLLKEKNVLKK